MISYPSHTKTEMSEEIKIYTDGSCSPNPGDGGYGFVILWDNFEITGSVGVKDTTNNIMELTAVIEALKVIPNIDKERKIHIYTDSTYVHNCAIGKFKRSKNLEHWKLYDSVSKNKDISYTWVKAHNGDPYNEYANTLANRGRLSL